MEDAIELMPYDPRWPAIFAAERDRLQPLFGRSAVDIQHIGSTAVPDLLAKPIIDIMVGLQTPPPPHAAAIAAVIGLGYEYRGEAGIPGRHFFRKGTPHTHHLHVVLFGGEIWNRQLLFRDYLRAHPDEAEAYADLKRALAIRYAHERETYTDSKGPFIAGVLERAKAWRRANRP